jgi:hypothetical protein
MRMSSHFNFGETCCINQEGGTDYIKEIEKTISNVDLEDFLVCVRQKICVHVT